MAAEGAGRRRLWIGAGVLAVGIAAAVALRRADLDWSAFDPEVLAARVRDAGSFGPVALFALFVLQCVIAPLPSEPLMMAAGYVYGPTVGFAIGLAGVTTGGAACFALARRFGRPFAERLVSARKLDALDAHLAGKSLAAVLLGVLVLRLFAFSSFDVLSYLCGILVIPFGWFLAVTAVGVVPKVFAFTYLGSSATAETPAWLDALIIGGTFGMLLLVPLWLRLRTRRPQPQP